VRATKTIGLAIVIIVALSALAGAASASQFRSEAYPTNLAGEIAVEPVISVANGKIKCSSTYLEGNESGSSSSMSLRPEPGGCKAYGLSAKVNPNGCRLVFSSTNNAAPFVGLLAVTCGAGESIEVKPTGSNCMVKIPGQAGVGPVSYETSGLATGRHIIATMAVSGLTYTENGSNCTKNGVTSTNGQISGSYSIYGNVPNGPLGVYIANEQIAETPQIKAEQYPAIVEGQNISSLRFTPNVGALGCSGARLSGSIGGAATSLTVHPELTGCNGTVVTTGCNFVIQNPVSGGALGTLGISCEAGKTIIWKYPGLCEFRIPTQKTPLSGVTDRTRGAGSARTVELAASVNGLEYTEVGSSCASPGVHTNGSLAGTWSLIGYRSVGGTFGSQQGLWYE
jgi:hypothetical protein